jgi:hypothetical protein
LGIYYEPTIQPDVQLGIMEGEREGEEKEEEEEEEDNNNNSVC